LQKCGYVSDFIACQNGCDAPYLKPQCSAILRDAVSKSPDLVPAGLSCDPMDIDCDPNAKSKVPLIIGCVVGAIVFLGLCALWRVRIKSKNVADPDKTVENPSAPITAQPMAMQSTPSYAVAAHTNVVPLGVPQGMNQTQPMNYSGLQEMNFSPSQGVNHNGQPGMHQNYTAAGTPYVHNHAPGVPHLGGGNAAMAPHAANGIYKSQGSFNGQRPEMSANAPPMPQPNFIGGPAHVDGPGLAQSNHGMGSTNYAGAPRSNQPGTLATAKFSFHPVNGGKDELPLAEGEEVIILERFDDGWAYGRREGSLGRPGAEGFFPLLYVEEGHRPYDSRTTPARVASLGRMKRDV
jgi:hypothetical protein